MSADGQPSAWLLVHGRLTVREGWAHIGAVEVTGGAT